MLMTNGYGLASIALLTVVMVTFGIAHGAGAGSLNEASIDERLTVHELTEEEPREPKYLPDKWYRTLEETVPQPEPNPWLQERVASAAVGAGNLLLQVADRSARWGYQNRAWIDPMWADALSRLITLATIITYGAAQVVRFRRLKREGSA
jgi:hypothetical protein